MEHSDPLLHVTGSALLDFSPRGSGFTTRLIRAASQIQDRCPELEVKIVSSRFRLNDVRQQMTEEDSSRDLSSLGFWTDSSFLDNRGRGLRNFVLLYHDMSILSILNRPAFFRHLVMAGGFFDAVVEDERLTLVAAMRNLIPSDELYILQ